MSLETFGLRLAYWEVNNEVRKKEIEPGELAEAEVKAAWTGRKYEWGYWRYYIRENSKGRIYIVREWVPAFGYSWSEIEIYTIPGE